MDQQLIVSSKSKSQVSIGLIIGIFVGVAAIIITIAVVILNILSNNPIIGMYSLYSTIQNGTESVDTVALTQSLGINMGIEFHEDGTGQIVTISTGANDEVNFSNNTINFSWANGKIDMEETATETSYPIKTITDYKLVDKDYIVVSSDDANFKVKFKRVNQS